MHCRSAKGLRGLLTWPGINGGDPKRNWGVNIAIKGSIEANSIREISLFRLQKLLWLVMPSCIQMSVIMTSSFSFLPTPQYPLTGVFWQETTPTKQRIRVDKSKGKGRSFIYIFPTVKRDREEEVKTVVKRKFHPFCRLAVSSLSLTSNYWLCKNKN